MCGQKGETKDYTDNGAGQQEAMQERCKRTQEESRVRCSAEQKVTSQLIIPRPHHDRATVYTRAASASHLPERQPCNAQDCRFSPRLLRRTWVRNCIGAASHLGIQFEASSPHNHRRFVTHSAPGADPLAGRAQAPSSEGRRFSRSLAGCSAVSR